MVENSFWNGGSLPHFTKAGFTFQNTLKNTGRLAESIEKDNIFEKIT